MNRNQPIPESLEDQVAYWRARAEYLGKLAHTTDGLVYTLRADPEEHWVVLFVDGTLPVEHPFQTELVGGKRVEDLVPPEVFANIKPAFRAAFRGERAAYEVEYSPGMWLLGTVKPFARDSRGRVTEVISSNGDVTARVIAEQQRLEQQDRLQALVMALPDLVFIFDHEGTFVGYNIGHEEELLASPSQFVGCRLDDIMPSQVSAEAHRVMDLVVKTGKGGEFKYALSLDGVEQFYHARMVPLGDDKVMAVVRNISDLVAAERDERIAATQLEVASRIARLGFWSWDPSLKRFTMSPEVFQMMNMEPVESPRIDDVNAALGAEALARVGPVGREVLASGEFRQIEFRIDRGRGDVRYFLTSMAMADDSAIGHPVLRGAIQEITEFRRLEAQLMHAQKMESIGSFAGAIAHDFNNMLQVVKGYSEVLKKNLSGNTQASGYVESILAATSRAGDLVSRILSFSRQSDMICAEGVIDRVVTEAVGMVEPLVGRSISLDVQTRCGETICCVDRAGIEQVLVNLAINARDAMPAGGVIGVRTSILEDGAPLTEARIAWPWLTSGSFACIDVSDTGSGIPDEIGDRIFEPFFTTKAEGVGTGLGLSSAYSIVRRHGGVLHVLKTGPGGTTFRIILPTVAS